tara:strand:- start:2350 stop:3015 length:666 start_codon:yes stop_codon:yes gene_type:complete
MKQINLFSLTKRNGTMDKKNKKRMRSLTQEEVVELVIWLGKNSEHLNGKTLPQIQRLLKMANFDDYPPKALRKCLVKFGIEIKRQPPKRKPVERATSQASIVGIQNIYRLQNQIDELAIELSHAREMIKDLAQVLIKTPPFTTETRKRFKNVRDDIERAIEDAEQIRRRGEVHSNTTGNSSEVQTVSERMESGNGAIQVASRLAKPNAGNPLRNSNNTNGG